MAPRPAARTLSYRPALKLSFRALPRTPQAESEQHSGDEWVGVDIQVRGTTKKR